MFRSEPSMRRKSEDWREGEKLGKLLSMWQKQPAAFSRYRPRNIQHATNYSENSCSSFSSTVVHGSLNSMQMRCINCKRGHVHKWKCPVMYWIQHHSQPHAWRHLTCLLNPALCAAVDSNFSFWVSSSAAQLPLESRILSIPGIKSRVWPRSQCVYNESRSDGGYWQTFQGSLWSST